MEDLVPVGVNRRNLIVNYVPNCFDDEKFLDLFIPYGPIERCKLVYRNSLTCYHQRHNAGFGFVMFIHAEHAAIAMNYLNGLSVCGKKLKVSYARNRPGTNVCIRGICKTWNEQDLFNLLSSYGPLVHLRLIYKKVPQVDNAQHPFALCYPQPPLSTGKAYAIFENHFDALYAITHLSKLIFPNCTCPMTFQLMNRSGADKRLFLKGVEQLYLGTSSYSTIEVKYINLACWSVPYVYAIFGEFGRVIQVYMVKQPNGSTTGCVIMADYIEAINAVMAIHCPPQCKIRLLTNYL